MIRFSLSNMNCTLASVIHIIYRFLCAVTKQRDYIIIVKVNYNFLMYHINEKIKLIYIEFINKNMLLILTKD